MMYPWTVDGGDSIQVWMKTVNILNEQLWIANKGWSPAWGLGKGTVTIQHKNQHVTTYYAGL